MSQSQYYEKEWHNHHDSSPSQWGYNFPESYYQQPYQLTVSYTPYQDQAIEEEFSLEKSFEAFLESTRQVQNHNGLNSFKQFPNPRSLL